MAIVTFVSLLHTFIHLTAAAPSHASTHLQVRLLMVPDAVLHHAAAAPCLPHDGLFPGGWCGGDLQDSAGLPHPGQRRALCYGHGGNAQGEDCVWISDVLTSLLAFMI